MRRKAIFHLMEDCFFFEKYRLNTDKLHNGFTRLWYDLTSKEMRENNDKEEKEKINNRTNRSRNDRCRYIDLCSI